MKKQLAIISFLIIAIIQIHTTKAEEVQVGLYLINLGKFDVATGSYTADFYLHFKCSQPCDPENFEFFNGRAASIDKIEDKPDEKFYRIQANLNSQIDLRKFPFDEQKMEIVLEDKKNTIDKIVYVPLKEESGIDKSIAFAGWNIDGWKAESRQHSYPFYNETYSQYVFVVDTSRIGLNSFIKTFLPVIFIVIIVIFSFLIDPDKIATRLAMAGSSLVAAVMFHVSITNQIPPVGYLTFADKFMGLSYIILLSTFIINILMLQFQELKKQELVERIHRSTEYLIFLVVPLLYMLLFFFFG